MNTERPSFESKDDLLEYRCSQEIPPLLAGKVVNIQGEDVRFAKIFHHFWDESKIENLDYISRLKTIIGMMDGYMMNNGVSQEKRSELLDDMERYCDSLKGGSDFSSESPEPNDSFIP